MRGTNVPSYHATPRRRIRIMRVAWYEGVREGNLHFASVQTEWDYVGFMEGAIRSGERCAAEI